MLHIFEEGCTFEKHLQTISTVFMSSSSWQKRNSFKKLMMGLTLSTTQQKERIDLGKFFFSLCVECWCEPDVMATEMVLCFCRNVTGTHYSILLWKCVKHWSRSSSFCWLILFYFCLVVAFKVSAITRFAEYFLNCFLLLSMYLFNFMEKWNEAFFPPLFSDVSGSFFGHIIC